MLSWNNEYYIAVNKTDKLAIYSSDSYLIIEKGLEEKKSRAWLILTIQLKTNLLNINHVIHSKNKEYSFV